MRIAAPLALAQWSPGNVPGLAHHGTALAPTGNSGSTGRQTPPPPIYCVGYNCPCGLDDWGAGCANSTGSGAQLIAGGTYSVSADNLTFHGSNLTAGGTAILFSGRSWVLSGLGVPFGNGLRCIGGGVVRLGIRVPGPAWNATWGPGLIAANGWIQDEHRYFQVWYRDPQGGACSSQFNTTNGYQLKFTP